MDFVAVLRSHQPVLIVALPALAASLALLGLSPRISIGLVLSALAAATFAAFDMLLFGTGAGEDGLGLRLGADTFSASAATSVMVLASAATTALVSAPAGGLAKTLRADVIAAGFAATAAGVAVLVDDLIVAAVAVQVAALAIMTVAARTGEVDRRALPAVFEAVLTIGVVGVVTLVGAALIGASTGAGTATTWIVTEGAGGASPRAFGGGVVLLMLGLAVLAAMAPVHGWAGPVMARGGFARGGVLVIVTISALFVLMRTAGAVLQTGDPNLPWIVCVGFIALGAVSMAMGALQALATTDFHRFAAALVVAHLGLAALGMGFGTPAGATGAFLQIGASVVALATVIAAASLCGPERGGLDGLGRRAPLTGAALTAALLTLLGAPLTMGFAAKWLIAAAALERGWYWAAWLVAAASLAGVVYTGRILDRLWLRASSAPAPRLSLAAPIAWAGGVACLAFGLDASAVLAVAQGAAAALLGMSS